MCEKKDLAKKLDANESIGWLKDLISPRQYTFLRRLKAIQKNIIISIGVTSIVLALGVAADVSASTKTGSNIVYNGANWAAQCAGKPHIAGYSEIGIQNSEIRFFPVDFTDTDPATEASLQDGTFIQNAISNVGPAMAVFWDSALGKPSTAVIAESTILHMPGTIATYSAANMNQSDFFNIARTLLPAGTEDYKSGMFEEIVFAPASNINNPFGFTYATFDNNGNIIKAAGEILLTGGYLNTSSDGNNKTAGHERGRGFGAPDDLDSNSIMNNAAQSQFTFSELEVGPTSANLMCPPANTVTPLPTITPTFVFEITPISSSTPIISLNREIYLPLISKPAA